jgi:hypothetical protein
MLSNLVYFYSSPPAMEGSASVKTTEEWVQAITTSDSVTALALTCDEHKPTIQELGFFNEYAYWWHALRCQGGYIRARV